MSHRQSSSGSVGAVYLVRVVAVTVSESSILWSFHLLVNKHKQENLEIEMLNRYYSACFQYKSFGKYIFVMFQAPMLLCNKSNNLISFRTCIINWPNSLEKLFPPQRTSLTLATILWMRETLSNIWIPSSYQELLAQRAVQKLEMWAEYYLSNIQCVKVLNI